MFNRFLFKFVLFNPPIFRSFSSIKQSNCWQQSSCSRFPEQPSLVHQFNPLSNESYPQSGPFELQFPDALLVFCKNYYTYIFQELLYLYFARIIIFKTPQQNQLIQFLLQQYIILVAQVMNKAQSSFLFLLKDRKKYYDLWKESRKQRENRVFHFLNQVSIDPYILKDLMKNQAFKNQFEQNVLFNLNPQKQVSILEKAIEQLQRKMLPKESKKVQFNYSTISGDSLTVTVIYHSAKFDPQYSVQTDKTYLIKSLFKSFIINQISKINFKINAETNKLRIFADKEYTQDKYTGAYTFDPFFNIVKFQLSQNRQSDFFKNNFKVINPEKITIGFLSNDNPQYWLDQHKFSSNDSIQKLIDYICKREEADAAAKKQFQQNLDWHYYKTVGDLLKVKQFKDISNKITRNKWAVELEIQLEKIRSPQVTTSHGKFSNHPEKLNCLKQAYSHKIMRYLFMKSNPQGDQEGLQSMKYALPLLNPDVVNNAIDLVKRDLIMDQLFEDIRQSFHSFTFVLRPDKKYETPTGMLFYGPPGTGKTKITEELAQLMGFHLVSNGLSSTVFQKELVGQSKGVAHSYLTRPLLSKHLICSLAIDEIDSLVLRRDSQNKNNTETLSKFLSALGGNEAVPNILLLASTNLMEKIDEAFLRRVVPNFYVGVPNKQQRKSIILSYLNQARPYIDFLVKITPNFSGAALKQIAQSMIRKIQQKKRKGEKLIFNDKELLCLANTAALNFKVKFGSSTYPRLYQQVQISRQFLDISFLENVKYKLGLMIETNDGIEMIYGIKLQCFQYQKKRPISQYCKSRTPISSLQPEFIFSWLQGADNILEARQLGDFIQKLKNYENPTFLIYNVEEKQISNCLKAVKQFKNLYICLYSKNNASQIQKLFIRNMKLQQPHSLRTGRILVDLSKQFPIMELQSKNKKNYPLQVFVKPFLQSCKRSSQTLPQIVQELIPRNLGLIKVVDSSYFTSIGAFQQQQCIQAINNLHEQCKKYKNFAIIFLIDSLIKINESISYSSTGVSKTLSINQPQLYHTIQNVIKNGSSFNSEQQHWVVIVVEDSQLSKMLRKEIKWPLNADQLKANHDQIKEQQKQKIRKENRICQYCRQLYTAQQNEKQRACLRHYGKFVHPKDYILLEEQSDIIDLTQAQFKQYKQNAFTQESQKSFIYSCCWKPLGEQGCTKFHHFSGNGDQKDELTAMMNNTSQRRQYQCMNLRQQLGKFLNNIKEKGIAMKSRK